MDLYLILKRPKSEFFFFNSFFLLCYGPMAKISIWVRVSSYRSRQIKKSLRLPYTFTETKLFRKIFFFDSNKVFVLSFHTEKKSIEKRVNNEGELQLKGNLFDYR